MPNHTSNLLTISGDENIVKEIRQWIEGEDEQRGFDFNKVILMPSELRGSGSPTRIMTEEEIFVEQKQREQDLEANPELKGIWGTEVGITQKEYDRRMEQYGAANWYDWSLQHWGTKWNAYDVKIDEFNINEIRFSTAWTPPCPVIKKMSELYPEVNFRLEYADEGGSFLGYSVFEKGELIDELDVDWDSEKGTELLKKLDRYFEDEEDEEDFED